MYILYIYMPLLLCFLTALEQVLKKKMDKQLGGGATINWEGELSLDNLRYAAHDARAHVEVHNGLIAGVASEATAGQRDAEASAAEDEVRATSDVEGRDSSGVEGMMNFVADVVPSTEDDGEHDDDDDDHDHDGDNDDDRDDDGDETEDAEGAAPLNRDQPGGQKHMTLVDACKLAIKAFADDVEKTSLRLPCALLADDRKKLHPYADGLGLSHKTIKTSGGEEDYMVVEKQSVHRQGPETTAARGSSGESNEGWDADWASKPVKYDIRHWMANFFLMAKSKESAIFKYFCSAVSDAVFKEDPERRKAVIEHLKKMGVDSEKIKRVKRRFFRKKGIYTIPKPRRLYQDLLAVFEFFSLIIDPSTAMPFFHNTARKIFEQQMKYVKAGYLSDPPGMTMYVKIGAMTTGLPLYRCVRSTSALEGYHLHLRQTVSAGGKNASPRWHDAVTNYFDFRWCVKALRKAGLMPQYIRHYDFQLYNLLYDIVDGLYDRQMMPGFRRIIRKEPQVIHGLHFALKLTGRVIRAGTAPVAIGGAGPPSSSPPPLASTSSTEQPLAAVIGLGTPSLSSSSSSSPSSLLSSSSLSSSSSSTPLSLLSAAATMAIDSVALRADTVMADGTAAIVGRREAARVAVSAGQSQQVAKRTTPAATNPYSLVGGNAGGVLPSLPTGISSGEWFAKTMQLDVQSLTPQASADDVSAILGNKSCLTSSNDVIVAAATRGVLMISNKSSTFVNNVIADERAWRVLNEGRGYQNLRSNLQQDNDAFVYLRGEMPSQSTIPPPPLGSAGRELELSGSAGIGLGVVHIGYTTQQAVATGVSPAHAAGAFNGDGSSDSSTVSAAATRNKRISKEELAQLTQEEQLERKRMLAKQRQQKRRKLLSGPEGSEASASGSASQQQS
jgi:hypothetical protein